MVVDVAVVEAAVVGTVNPETAVAVGCGVVERPPKCVRTHCCTEVLDSAIRGKFRPVKTSSRGRTLYFNQIRQMLNNVAYCGRDWKYAFVANGAA